MHAYVAGLSKRLRSSPASVAIMRCSMFDTVVRMDFSSDLGQAWCYFIWPVGIDSRQEGSYRSPFLPCCLQETSGKVRLGQ